MSIETESQTWYAECIQVMNAQRAPRGVGSRRAAQGLDAKFNARVAKAARENGIEYTSQLATIKALDEAGVPNA